MKVVDLQEFLRKDMTPSLGSISVNLSVMLYKTFTIVTMICIYCQLRLNSLLILVVRMSQVLRSQVFSLILLEADVINKLTNTSCEVIFPMKMTNYFLKNTELLNDMTTEARNKTLFTLQDVDDQSRYSTSTSIESLLGIWKEKDVPTIILLDSFLASIISFRYSLFHSYIIRLRPGSPDYNFEYVEFILGKLLRHGFSLYGLGDLKQTHDLIRCISENNEICFYASPNRGLGDNHIRLKRNAFIILDFIKKLN